jgi:hypothetical protein
MTGSQFGYGAQPGEYGDISSFGYAARPGEYGVDTGHGPIPMLQGMQYNSAQGPSTIPYEVRHQRMWHPASRRVLSGPKTARRRRPSWLSWLIAALVLARVLVAAYDAADQTRLQVQVEARAAGATTDAVRLELEGRLAWSKTKLTAAVVDTTDGRPLPVIGAGSTCRRERDHAIIRAAGNRPIVGDCNLIVHVRSAQRGDRARLVLAVDGTPLRLCPIAFRIR